MIRHFCVFLMGGRFPSLIIKCPLEEGGAQKNSIDRSRDSSIGYFYRSSGCPRSVVLSMTENLIGTRSVVDGWISMTHRCVCALPFRSVVRTCDARRCDTESPDAKRRRLFPPRRSCFHHRHPLRDEVAACVVVFDRAECNDAVAV